MHNQLNNSLSIFAYWKKCISYALFPVISLVIYMSLRSSELFAAEDIASNYFWHPAYTGWYDLLLACSILLSFIFGIIRLEKDTLIFILTLATIIILSLISKLDILGGQYVFDTLVYLVRFIVSFSLAKELVSRLGTQTVEGLVILLFIVLAISAVLVYTLQFGINNRIYAASMTAPSFGHLAATISLIAVIRNYKIILLISSVFLFLTFSRTSIALLFIFLFAYSFNFSIATRFKYYLITTVITITVMYLFVQYGGDAFEDIIYSRTDIEEIYTLNARNEIWKSAVSIITSGSVPLFGAGFIATPYLIENANLKFLTSEGWYVPPHFHSIIFEYILSLGISSLLIFYYLFKRVWQTFNKKECLTAFFIFAFFLCSQSLDFTLYRPKEIIITGILLGLAEGDWKTECNRN